MNNFLYYNTPVNQYSIHYPQLQTPFNIKRDISTQLLPNAAIIRVITTLAFTALAALRLRATILCRPIVIAGAAFVGWTIYRHLLSQDPLMEAFYKIVGGKDKFEELEEINLGQTKNEKISDRIQDFVKNLDWDHANLNQPMYRAKTLDNRNIVLVKGIDRQTQKKSILAFIEKNNQHDFPDHAHLPLALKFLIAMLIPDQQRYSQSFSYSGKGKIGHYCIATYLSGEMAAEFFAQM